MNGASRAIGHVGGRMRFGKRKRVMVLLASMGATAIPSAARADRYYVGPPNGNWNSSANWSATPGGVGGAGVPTAGEFVFIRNADGVDRNIVLNVSTPALARLRIDNSGGGVNTLVQ